MTFRANSMTFKIDPEKWEYMPNYRLKEEFEEFVRWFGFNENGLSQNDAEAGWKLVKNLKQLLEDRGIDTTAYLYIDSAARKDTQISFFPSHQ